MTRSYLVGTKAAVTLEHVLKARNRWEKENGEGSWDALTVRRRNALARDASLMNLDSLSTAIKGFRNKAA